ncbi:MAG: hypothetical protein WCI96_13030 [Planctomycetota bacterium]
MSDTKTFDAKTRTRGDSIANLTSKTTVMHGRIMESVTPFNNALHMPDVAAAMDLNTDAGRALLDAMVTKQAAVIAYQNDFLLLMYLTLATLPLLLLLGVPKQQKPAAKQGNEVHVLD